MIWSSGYEIDKYPAQFPLLRKIAKIRVTKVTKVTKPHLLPDLAKYFCHPHGDENETKCRSVATEGWIAAANISAKKPPLLFCLVYSYDCAIF